MLNMKLQPSANLSKYKNKSQLSKVKGGSTHPSSLFCTVAKDSSYNSCDEDNNKDDDT